MLSQARLVASRALPFRAITSVRSLFTTRPSHSPIDCDSSDPNRSKKTHGSNAEELIWKVPVVEVEGLVAVCDGGGGKLGHPVEYIQLNKRNLNEPEICKYCGLRFIQKSGGHHHHH
eukprot:GILI01007783.1.p1 GENE.GILI01007783.1~~GILI01007783.1.p1  ORF type:complete len:133 (-),score=31.65 GILI01007783.1:95-445(-)